VLLTLLLRSPTTKAASAHPGSPGYIVEMDRLIPRYVVMVRAVGSSAQIAPAVIASLSCPILHTEHLCKWYRWAHRVRPLGFGTRPVGKRRSR
jgi:hypothetical protein